MSQCKGESISGRQSGRLGTMMRLVEPHTSVPIHAFWSHPDLGRMLPDFMFTAYCVCRSSVHLLQTAAEWAKARSGRDRLNGLARYYMRHATEEMHHDEWMLEDMLVFGMDRAEILARPPSPAIAALVGAQYYWIFHAHPAALLGYLAALEGHPMSAEHLREVQAKHHFPPGTFRTLLEHADLDTHHRDEINEQLDQLPLSKELSSLITMSAFHTMDAVGQAIQDILDAHTRPKRN